MIKKYNKTLRIIIIVVLTIAVLATCFIKNNKTSYSFEVTSTILNKDALRDMTEEEQKEYYKDFWEKIYSSENIRPSNKKFYRRFTRAYAFWTIRAADSQDDLAILEASKPHLLTALFLDYAPDNFNSEISEWAVNGDLDNIFINEEEFAYQVCDNAYYNGVSENDQTCTAEDGNLIDESYSTVTLSQLIRTFAANLIREIQKYIDEKDTITALGRHLFVYGPSCIVSEKKTDGTLSTFTYKYPKKYTFDEILELFSQVESLNLLNFYSIFPEFVDCEGPSSKWLTANGGTGYETVFDLSDTVDLCAFYKHLVESDYFEKHVHFKSDFEAIKKYTKTDQEYLVEASKLKVGLARQIIDIVTLSNDYDPVYDTSATAATGANASYSLSKDLYITVGNDRTDSNGNVIRGASYPIDQYVEGVLDAEVLGAFYGTSESSGAIYTALQANAIAIRTYALKVTAEGTKPISNSTANQVFTDKHLDDTSDKYTAARNAARSTTEQVLTENNKLIMSEYSSFSKNTNYKCEGELCYTSYQKIGSKNSGTLHTVIAKKSWGLAGGHNRGMSQWGSLYLAANGYSYQQILADFYSENVKIANYDYSYKNTGRTTLGEYGVKEAMLVCDLFTSSEFSDIRDLLGDNVTLEIPLRTTSTKYQSVGGSSSSTDEPYNNGINYWRVSKYGNIHPGSRKCQWKDENADLLYRCVKDEKTGTFEGVISGMQGVWQVGGSIVDGGYEVVDTSGNPVTAQYGMFIKDMTFDNSGNPTVIVTSNPDEIVSLTMSGAPSTKTDDPTWISDYVSKFGKPSSATQQLPHAMVWQHLINTIAAATGLDAGGLATEGGKWAHVMDEGETNGADIYLVAAGFSPTNTYSLWGGQKSKPYMDYNTSDDGSIYDYETVITGYECASDEYELSNTTCCLVNNKSICVDATPVTEKRVKYYESTESSGLTGRYARYADNKTVTTGLDGGIYTGLDEREAADYVDQETRDNFLYANSVNTVIYAYTTDKSSVPAEMVPFLQDTARNVLQANEASDLGSSFISANMGLYELKSESGGAFINLTEYLDYYGFGSPGGVASLAISELEAHHFDSLCNYYAPHDEYPNWFDYCCKGLITSSTDPEETRKNYSSFGKDKITYDQVSSALGGYFSDAWKIEFCTDTLEGRELVRQACIIALDDQEDCYSQCYATGITEQQKAFGYTKDSKGYLLDQDGKHLFDYTKTAIHCKYKVTSWGGTATYTTSDSKNNTTTQGTIDEWREIPYHNRTDAGLREFGGCPCELILEN